MRYQVLPIVVEYQKAGIQAEPNQDNGLKGFSPSLSCYLPDNSPEIDPDLRRPAVVVCPGGGYYMTSDREAEPIALSFAAAGYHAFVLRYSVSPMRFPGALLELSQAVAMIRRNAEQWQVDPDRIFVCGFSAGGHLTASLGVHWNKRFVTEPLGLSKGENRPNGLILSYPVISSEARTAHMGSFQNLFSGHPTPEELEVVSCERQVNMDTPPCFLWHTCNDSVVPIRNSLLFASALAEREIPFELHVYPNGPHGLALSSPVTGRGMVVEECQEWIREAVRWIGQR